MAGVNDRDTGRVSADSAADAAAEQALRHQWYVPHERGDQRRFLGPDGLPTLHLIPYVDTYGEHVLRLCDDSTGQLVAPKDGRLAHAGLLSAQVNGESYNADGCRNGDFSLGAPALLVPEPDNAFDSLAVAVYDGSGQHRCGYLSRNRARQYHRRRADGEVLVAMCVRGTPAGQSCEQVGILSATEPRLSRVRAPRPAELPPPMCLR